MCLLECKEGAQRLGLRVVEMAKGLEPTRRGKEDIEANLKRPLAAPKKAEMQPNDSVRLPEMKARQRDTKLMRRMPRARREQGRDDIDVDGAASDSREKLELTWPRWYNIVTAQS